MMSKHPSNLPLIVDDVSINKMLCVWVMQSQLEQQDTEFDESHLPRPRGFLD